MVATPNHASLTATGRDNPAAHRISLSGGIEVAGDIAESVYCAKKGPLETGKP